MRDLIVIGAGDFGRETIWLAERMNLQDPQWNILGFVDDGEKPGTLIDEYPVLGSLTWLRAQTGPIYAVCAIGTARIRSQIWNSLKDCHQIQAATLIDPSAIVGKGCEIGGGCILCAGTILTVHVKLGAHCIINLNCTIGHDTILEDCCTVHPGSNLSGKVHIGRCTDIGTGTKIIQGHSVAPGTILGAGTVVTKDLETAGTYVGVPARLLKPAAKG